MADMCRGLAPEICAECECWHTNDGDGLGDEASVALAEVLERRIGDGTIARLISKRAAYLEGLPDEVCAICDGTGVREAIERKPGGLAAKLFPIEPSPSGKCNGCEGKGKCRPFETNYPASVENVAEFAAFLRDSGGFSIC